jgi:single-strand DNA-binding protein
MKHSLAPVTQHSGEETLASLDAAGDLALALFACAAVGLMLGIATALYLRRRQLSWTWATPLLAPFALVLLVASTGLLAPRLFAAGLTLTLAAALSALAWGAHAELEDRRVGGDREIAAGSRRRLLDGLRSRRQEVGSRREQTLGDGIPIGRTQRGELALIARGSAESGHHVLIPGATGAGKTTTLASLLVDYVARSGFGAVVLEAKSDQTLLEATEAAAWAKGTAFHLVSPDGPATYDPLAHGSVDERSERLIAVEDWGSSDADFYRQAASPFLRLVLRTLDRSMRAPTLAAVAANCDPDELRGLSISCEDAAIGAEVTQVLKVLRADQKRAIAGLGARLQNLSSSEFARHWLDPERSGAATVDLRAAIARGEVVYLRFDTDRTGNVGRAIAQMVLLDLGATASAMMGRGVGTFVAIDEFGALEAPALERLYARGRAAGFSVALGTQTLADLQAAGPAVRERIGATISALVCHRIGGQADAEWVGQLIGAVPTWQTTIRTEGYARHTAEGTRTRGYRFEVNPSELQRLDPGEVYVARLERSDPTRARRARVVPPWRRLPQMTARSEPSRPTPLLGASRPEVKDRGSAPQKEHSQMNSVTLIGTLTRDPEVHGEEETSRVCQMRLAGSGPRDGAPLFVDVAAFGRQGENCHRYLTKGRLVAVVGQLRFREWESEQGRRSELSIAAERVEFLPGGKGKEPGLAEDPGAGVS